MSNNQFDVDYRAYLMEYLAKLKTCSINAQQSVLAVKCDIDRQNIIANICSIFSVTLKVKDFEYLTDDECNEYKSYIKSLNKSMSNAIYGLVITVEDCISNRH